MRKMEKSPVWRGQLQLSVSPPHLPIDEGGAATAASIRGTLHGLDACGIAEHEGLLVPAVTDEESHRAVQEATWDEVLASPRIPLEQLLDEDSSAFSEDGTTFLPCD